VTGEGTGSVVFSERGMELRWEVLFFFLNLGGKKGRCSCSCSYWGMKGFR
jgi:hypothetical protein